MGFRCIQISLAYEEPTFSLAYVYNLTGMSIHLIQLNLNPTIQVLP